MTRVVSTRGGVRRLLAAISLCFLFATAGGRCAESVAAPTTTTEPDDAPGRLSWFSSTSPERRWQATLDPGPEANTSDATPLEGSYRFPPLPGADVELFDGGTLSLQGTRGQVVLLAFWASWCVPCEAELPRLQAMQARWKERGLVTLAINVGETEQVARPFARRLGLTIPLGRSHPELTRELEVQGMPTVILADRQGRIRYRWSGYLVEDEVDVERAVALLVEDDRLPRHELARVVTGAGRLEARWIVDVPDRIDAVTVIRFGDRPPGLLVAHRREWDWLPGTAGEPQRWAVAPVAVLRSIPRAGGRDPLVIGFRPGSQRLASLAPLEGSVLSWSASGAVFDVAFRPGSGEGQPTETLLLATLSGVREIRDGGKDERGAGEAPGALGIATCTPKDGPARVVTLAQGGRVAWNDLDLAPLLRQQGPANGWRLIAGKDCGTGVGVAPSDVRAAVVGRFLEGGAAGVALATESEQLVVLDAGSGAEVFRARWPKIRALAAGDLDGDGAEELVVTAGRRLAVLSAAGAK